MTEKLKNLTTKRECVSEINRQTDRHTHTHTGGGEGKRKENGLRRKKYQWAFPLVIFFFPFPPFFTPFPFL